MVRHGATLCGGHVSVWRHCMEIFSVLHGENLRGDTETWPCLRVETLHGGFLRADGGFLHVARRCRVKVIANDKFIYQPLSADFPTFLARRPVNTFPIALNNIINTQAIASCINASGINSCVDKFYKRREHCPEGSIKKPE